MQPPPRPEVTDDPGDIVARALAVLAEASETEPTEEQSGSTSRGGSRAAAGERST